MTTPTVHICENLEVVFSGIPGCEDLDTIKNLGLFDISKALDILSDSGIETVSERHFRDYNGGKFSHQKDMYGYTSIGTNMMAKTDADFRPDQRAAIEEASQEMDKAIQAVADYLTEEKDA